MKILLVEDEKNLRATIISFLKEEGYCCEQADTIGLALEKLSLYEYDCLLLDIGLPDGNGLDLIQKLKTEHPETGIIVISAKNSLEDKVTGLDLGADDYIAKPFNLTELNSRIKSIFRRIKFGGKKEIVIDCLHIFPENRQVFVYGQLIVLTKKEFDLLIYFISNPQRVLTKEAIAEHLWGDFADSVDSFDFVYSQIKNLRHKLLEKTGIDYIQNIYASGYSFNPNK
ncbi:MAG: response regulator transcription factor [Paludibacteraceae bacterium]|nr:response regulator transcription factor [Paludibacteraceae bacterium]